MEMVYVVDDAADYRFLLEKLVKQAFPQHTVRLFDDGRTFCQHICPVLRLNLHSSESDKPRLILLDLHMPGLNGLQTMACLSQLPEWRLIPVIVLSATTDQAEIDACYNAGARAVVSKVISLQQLSHIIRTALDE